MSTRERAQRGQPRPSFEGESQAFPDEERAGDVTALAIAIAEAATAAAAYATDNELGTMTFTVSKSSWSSPNPGPRTYRAGTSAGRLIAPPRGAPSKLGGATEVAPPLSCNQLAQLATAAGSETAPIRSIMSGSAA